MAKKTIQRGELPLPTATMINHDGAMTNGNGHDNGHQHNGIAMHDVTAILAGRNGHSHSGGRLQHMFDDAGGVSGHTSAHKHIHLHLPANRGHVVTIDGVVVMIDSGHDGDSPANADQTAHSSHKNHGHNSEPLKVNVEGFGKNETGMSLHLHIAGPLKANVQPPKSDLNTISQHAEGQVLVHADDHDHADMHAEETHVNGTHGQTAHDSHNGTHGGHHVAPGHNNEGQHSKDVSHGR